MLSTKADDIALRLEEAIVAGELPPGSVLRQDRLAKRFGVSRTPIREALQRLSAFGLVEFVPNRGMWVRDMSIESFREMFAIRGALEALAAERAATRATTAQLAELRAFERQFAERTHELRSSSYGEDEQPQLARAWVAANAGLHDVILKAAQAPLLEDMARGVRRVFVGLALWTPGPEIDALFDANLKQHHEIVEAIASRRAEAAAKLMREHLEASVAILEYELALHTGTRSARGNGGRAAGGRGARSKRGPARVASS